MTAGTIARRAAAVGAALACSLAPALLAGGCDTLGGIAVQFMAADDRTGMDAIVKEAGFAPIGAAGSGIAPGDVVTRLTGTPVARLADCLDTPPTPRQQRLSTVTIEEALVPLASIVRLFEHMSLPADRLESALREAGVAEGEIQIGEAWTMTLDERDLLAAIASARASDDAGCRSALGDPDHEIASATLVVGDVQVSLRTASGGRVTVDEALLRKCGFGAVEAVTSRFGAFRIARPDGVVVGYEPSIIDAG